MTLLIRIESNILDVVLRVALVFELSVVTKAFSFNDNRKLINIDLQTCQFILKAIVSAGILLFWLVKSFYSLLLDQEKKKKPQYILPTYSSVIIFGDSFRHIVCFTLPTREKTSH